MTAARLSDAALIRNDPPIDGPMQAPRRRTQNAHTRAA